MRMFDVQGIEIAAERSKVFEHARWALEVHRSTRPRTSSVDFARRIAAALDSHESGSRG